MALAQQVLLPVLVWRAGKHPAAARHAALTALVTMLRARQLGEGGVLELVDHARLLPLLHQVSCVLTSVGMGGATLYFLRCGW